MIRVDPETESRFLRSENAYLRGKIEAYENLLKLNGFIEQEECRFFQEGLEDATRD